MARNAKGQITAEDNPKPFSKTNPPKNPGRKPENITAWLKQELKSDGYAVMKGEIVDEQGNRTGQMVNVRVKLITEQAVAKRLLANANAGKERSIEMILDRTEGKVPQRLDLGAPEGTTVTAIIETPANPLYQGPESIDTQ